MEIITIENLKKLPIEKIDEQIDELSDLPLEKAKKFRFKGTLGTKENSKKYYGKYFKILSTTEELNVILNPNTHIRRIDETEYIILNNNGEVKKEKENLEVENVIGIRANSIMVDMLLEFLVANKKFINGNWILSWINILKKIKSEKGVHIILEF